MMNIFVGHQKVVVPIGDEVEVEKWWNSKLLAKLQVFEFFFHFKLVFGR